MTTLAEVRQKYPQYKDLSDEELAQGLHKKFYSDIPYEDFTQRIGITAQAPEPTEEPGFMQDLGRQASLTGRAAINAVAAVPAMAMDLGVGARNMTEQAVRKYAPGVAEKIDSVANRIGIPSGPGAPYELPSREFQKSLTQAGVPEPQTFGEKITGFIQSTMLGARMPAPQISNPAPAGFKPPDMANATQIQTLRQAQKAGYVVPPASSNPSTMNRALEGASGKIATAQQAAVRNQAVTNQLARQALGMANDTPITPESLKALRSNAGRVYETVAKAGEIIADEQYLDDLAKLGQSVDEVARDFPEANVGASKEVSALVDSLLKEKFDSRSALAYLRLLRKQASGNLSYLNSADPSKQALGMAQKEAAATLEDLIGRHLAANGSPEVAKSFEQARRLIAVSHTVENALNEATGNVAASKLGQQLAKGKPLTGELAVAAKFARAFPKAAKEVTESMPGISPLDYYGSIGAAGLFGSPHLLLLPAARMAIREALLSPYGQQAAVAGAKSAVTPQTLGAPASAALQATSTVLRQ